MVPLTPRENISLNHRDLGLSDIYLPPIKKSIGLNDIFYLNGHEVYEI